MYEYVTFLECVCFVFDAFQMLCAFFHKVKAAKHHTALIEVVYVDLQEGIFSMKTEKCMDI